MLREQCQTLQQNPFSRLRRPASYVREEICRISIRIDSMNSSPGYSSTQPVPEEIDVARSEHDVLPHLQPLDEAINVAFLAVRAAQQAARELPASAPTAKFRVVKCACEQCPCAPSNPTG